MLKLIIITICIVLLFIIILKYKQKKNSKIYIRILFILLFIVIVFPIENIVKKFESLEEAFKYYFSDYIIIDKQKLGEEYLVFYGDTNHTLSYAKFNKKNNKWKLSSYIYANFKTKIVYNNECLITEYFPNKEKVALNIKCDIKDSGEKNYYIQNSKLEELKKVSFENNTYYGLFNRGEYILVSNEKIYLD